MGGTLTVRVAVDPADVARVVAAVEHFGAEQAVPKKVVLRVMMAIEELVLNTILYGCADGQPHLIEVGVRVVDGAMICDIRDDGTAFDPFTQAPTPDLTSSVPDRRVGGLGIHLVGRTMDEACYRREGGFNYTRLVKKI